MSNRILSNHSGAGDGPSQKSKLSQFLADEKECPELNGVFIAEIARTPRESEYASQLRIQSAQRRKLWQTSTSNLVLQSNAPQLVKQQIVGESNLLPFDFLRSGDKVGRAVVKIQRSDGAAGTGFLVAPDILLTNNHVLSDPDSAQTAYALANYERHPPDELHGFPAVARLKPQILFVTSSELDFTFVAVEGIDYLGAVPIDRDSLNLIENEYVNLIQHPRGRPKEIAVQDSQVFRTDSLVAQYSCDTEPGSSGSPVFNNQWRLVALHHASIVTEDFINPALCENCDLQSKNLATARYLNEGIRLSAIAVWLETYKPNTPEEGRQIDRLRSIVQGLDPQIGFFGALGHVVEGKTAAQIVDESYRGTTSKLDIALWNLRGIEGVVRGRIDELTRLVADMRMDIWILTSVDPDAVEIIANQLKTTFGLDFHYLHDRDSLGRMVSVLYNRSRGLELTPLAWPFEPAIKTELTPPLLLKVEIPWARRSASDVHLVPLFWSSWAAAPSTDLQWVQSIAAQAKLENPADWLIFGSSESLLSPENLLALSPEEDRLLIVSDESDGAFALLSNKDWGIERVYASSYLVPALGHPDRLVIAIDRKLPSSFSSWGGHAPIAVRLVLKDAPAMEIMSPLNDNSSGRRAD